MPPIALRHARSVREIMTPEPVCVGTDASMREVVGLLREHDVSGLPVIAADGRVVGVVSITDLFRRTADSIVEAGSDTPLERLLEEAPLPLRSPRLDDEPFGEGDDGELEAMEDAFGPPDVTVAELMTPEALTCDAGSDAASLAHRMAEQGVHRAIVVDAGGGAVGIVTSLDLLRAYPDANGSGPSRR